MSRDIDKRITKLPIDPKVTRGSTWRPRASDQDIINNNDEGAPPVPVGQPADREQGTESDGPVGGH